LGVFDPILNFDTKLFVDPMLLKSSKSTIIKKSENTFDEFFEDILLLLKSSKKENDKPWREAKRRIKFPEYKYTCIGYGRDSIEGSGSGSHLSEKIFEDALEIVSLGKSNPKMFLLLPLLEEGVGADRISDMTQTIIDDDICIYTLEIMSKLELKGNLEHKNKNHNEYKLLKNPYSNTPIKLLPRDILKDLPLVDSFSEVIESCLNANWDLRVEINKKLGTTWFECNKKEKRESFINQLKNDKEFFVQVLKAIEEVKFAPYDIEIDKKGLHRWIEDSKKFKYIFRAGELQNIEDSVESISKTVKEIIEHFQNLLESENFKYMLWTKANNKPYHVIEIYLKMLFFMVADSWLKAQKSNLKIDRKYNEKTNEIDFKFYISDRYKILVHLKHSYNNSLLKAYEKMEDYHNIDSTNKSFFVVLDFFDNDNNQLKEILSKQLKFIENICINTWYETSSIGNKKISKEPLTSLIEFEDLNLEGNSKLHEYRKKGGNKRHELTNLIKNEIIKPMYLNKDHMKGQSIRQKAQKIYDKLKDLSSKKDDQLQTLANEFSLQYEILEQSKEYFDKREDKFKQVYNWCLGINKNSK
jgi:hypothetical protein